MTGAELKAARNGAGWTQRRAAEPLGVTQAYLSMLERGDRPVTEAFAKLAAKFLPIDPVALPFVNRPPEHFEDALGALGYPGFAYLRNSQRMNPAELFLFSLDTDDLPARVVEGLPWLPLAFPHLNWEWLLREAKLRSRQNRLGYILELSEQAARRSGKHETASFLARTSASLAVSLLAAEDTLCNASMTDAERKWLRTHSSVSAARWNLINDLKLSHLDHVHV